MRKENYIKKIVLDYSKFIKFISFNKIETLKKSFLEIKGFFGSRLLLIPNNVDVQVDAVRGKCFLYFNIDLDYSKLKFFYNNIIFSAYGILYFHLVEIMIKGIGYKFELDGGKIKVYTGKVLPITLNIPKNLDFLKSSNSNVFCVGSGDYLFLKNFITKIYKEGLPNKYKEIGIFLNEKL